MEKVKALNLIGIAYRAKKIVNGYDSSKTIEAFSKKCYFYHVPMYMDFNTDEISKAIGKGLCKVICLTDDGFNKSLNKLLSEV